MLIGHMRPGVTAIGVRVPLDLREGAGTFLPECVSVEIGIQTHSNCMKNKSVYNSHVYSEVIQCRVFRR